MDINTNKEINNLITSKLYEYIDDYVISALTLSITDTYIEIQNYREEVGENFGISHVNQILEYLNIEDVKNDYDNTCESIPVIFFDLYTDILSELSFLYDDSLINCYRLTLEDMELQKSYLVDLFNRNSMLLYSGLRELKLIIERLRFLLYRMAKVQHYNSIPLDDQSNKIWDKFRITWKSFIKGYDQLVNIYLETVYPSLVQVIFDELNNTLSKKLEELIRNLDEKNYDLGKAYFAIDSVFKRFMAQ